MVLGGGKSLWTSDTQNDPTATADSWRGIQSRNEDSAPFVDGPLTDELVLPVRAFEPGRNLYHAHNPLGGAAGESGDSETGRLVQRQWEGIDRGWLDANRICGAHQKQVWMG